MNTYFKHLSLSILITALCIGFNTQCMHAKKLANMHISIQKTRTFKIYKETTKEDWGKFFKGPELEPFNSEVIEATKITITPEMAKEMITGLSLSCSHPNQEENPKGY